MILYRQMAPVVICFARFPFAMKSWLSLFSCAFNLFQSSSIVPWSSARTSHVVFSSSSLFFQLLLTAASPGWSLMLNSPLRRIRAKLPPVALTLVYSRNETGSSKVYRVQVLLNTIDYKFT